MFEFYLFFVPLLRVYGAVLYTTVGQNVTLQCFYASSVDYLVWYKQVPGEQPRIISYFYKHLPEHKVFYDPFKNNKRFSVHPGEGFYHLNISNVLDWDSAMYYCGKIIVTFTEFDNGTYLLLKESNRGPFLQQPASESVEPGGSVNLTCTVHAGGTDTDHSVYWFRKDSANSPLGTLHVHRRSSGRSVQPLGSPAATQSCEHSLSRSNVSLSDAGTYYCAVASCGHIVFGNGTRLNVGETQGHVYSVSLLCAAAALLVSVFLNVVLICIYCKKVRRRSHHSAGLMLQSSVTEHTNDSQEMDALQYAALGFKKRQTKKRQRSTEEETIYSAVRKSDLN